VRVLVVEDHRVVGEAFRAAIDLEDGFECVGVVSSVGAAVALLPRADPDVVLMDVRLPGVDGIQGTRQIKAAKPSVRVLIVSAHTDVEVVAWAAAAGASAVLTKEVALADMVTALNAAGTSGMVVDDLALGKTVSFGSAPPDRHLTEREREILALLSGGLNPKSIAARTGISVETVRGHLKSIMGKLGAHSQVEAVVIAASEGLTSLAPLS